MDGGCHISLDDGGIAAATQLPGFARMLAYWREKAGNRPAPRRADIDPLLSLPGLAPDMLLWDVESGERYVCRLAGTHVCRIGGRELRGLSLDDIRWEDPTVAHREFGRVVTTLVPHFVARGVADRFHGFQLYRRLLLPLSEDGRRANKLWSLVSDWSSFSSRFHAHEAEVPEEARIAYRYAEVARQPGSRRPRGHARAVSLTCS
jgi:hypothetical protein